MHAHAHLSGLMPRLIWASALPCPATPLQSPWSHAPAVPLVTHTCTFLGHRACNAHGNEVRLRVCVQYVVAAALHTHTQRHAGNSTHAGRRLYLPCVRACRCGHSAESSTSPACSHAQAQTYAGRSHARTHSTAPARGRTYGCTTKERKTCNNRAQDAAKHLRMRYKTAQNAQQGHLTAVQAGPPPCKVHGAGGSHKIRPRMNAFTITISSQVYEPHPCQLNRARHGPGLDGLDHHLFHRDLGQHQHQCYPNLHHPTHACMHDICLHPTCACSIVPDTALNLLARATISSAMAISADRSWNATLRDLIEVRGQARGYLRGIYVHVHVSEVCERGCVCV